MIQLVPLTRARIVLAMILVCGLGTIRLAVTSLQQFRKSGGRGVAARFIEKYSAAGPFLTSGQPVGYLPDPAHMDLDLMPLTGRLSLAQYSLSPPVVGPLADQSLMLFESDDPRGMPDPETVRAWTLVVDLQNGLKLFRRREQG